MHGLHRSSASFQCARGDTSRIRLWWNVRIDNNDALVSLDGLGQLLEGEIQGDIVIRKNRQLESLSSFLNLDTIRGDLTLEDNTKLSDLSGFESVHTITGDLIVAGNARLVTIESLSRLEHVGDITITRNPILDSVAGLRNLQTVGDIYIRGDGIVSIENVGQYLHFAVQRTTTSITNNACINDDGMEYVCFVNKLALTYQESFDETYVHKLCLSRELCLWLQGHGMCICPNSNQVRPLCWSVGTIEFYTRNSDLVYDVVEPLIGFTRVGTIRIPIRRNVFSTTSTAFPQHYEMTN